VPLGRKLKKD